MTAYSAYRGLVLRENPLSLVRRGFFEKPGTGMLFRSLHKDNVTKWKRKNTAMKIFQGGSSVNKLKIIFYDGGYKYHEDD